MRVYFGGIYSNVRELLIGQIGKLNNRYRKTHDAAPDGEYSSILGVK